MERGSHYHIALVSSYDLFYNTLSLNTEQNSSEGGDIEKLGLNIKTVETQFKLFLFSNVNF